jgi:non-ribosomal peptide synthetase component F
MHRAYPFEPGEVCCQKTALGFVDAVWEMFGGLLRGVPTVIVPDDAVLDPDAMIALLAERRISRIVVVPTLLRVLLDHTPDLGARLPSLRWWTVSGEALDPDLAWRFQRALPSARLLNLYGSAEVAGDATVHEISAEDRDVIPIGKPISNTRIYILDDGGQPFRPGCTAPYRSAATASPLAIGDGPT